MEVLTGSGFGGSLAGGSWVCAANRNGQHIRIEQARAHPAGVLERAGRWREDNLEARIIEGRFRRVGALRIHQRQVLQNSIYVAVLGLAELVYVGAEGNRSALVGKPPRQERAAIHGVLEPRVEMVRH